MPESPTLVSILLGVLTGLGLAAACGFRIFVPLLIASLAARAGALSLHEDFAWLGGTPALVCLIIATLLEVAGYYVPVVDNLLDTVATPAAAIAGAVVALAVFTDMDPWLRWSLGLVAGSGLATTVHLPIAAARGATTVSTAGLGNSSVATGEVVGASAVSGLAIFAPIALPMVLIAIVAGVIGLRRRARARASNPGRKP